mmetsp:Transcript_399/g.1358  ORF Transcript_399/g.1358 Transcript_399/m.1358 type:complete len:120 (-) Transcript_399:112-471(-)
MRGPDGSMVRAVDGMYTLRRMVFMQFGMGMMALLVTCIFGSWLLMDPEAAFGCTLLLSYSIYLTHKSYTAITKMFHFNEAEAVNFDDLLAATQTLIPQGKKGKAGEKVSRRAVSGEENL